MTVDEAIEVATIKNYAQSPYDQAAASYVLSQEVVRLRLEHAAAPDFLAACEDYVQLFRDSDMRPEDECTVLFKRMKAAIAKAKELK